MSVGKAVVLGIAVLLGIGALWSAIRDQPVERPRWWLLWPLFLWTGDAAVGDHRPVLERVTKGLLAVVVGGSLAISAWRWRRASREPDPEN